MTDNISGYRVEVTNRATGHTGAATKEDYRTDKRYGMSGEMSARYAADKMCEFLNDSVGAEDEYLNFSVVPLYRPSIGADGMHRSECLCIDCEIKRDSIGGIPGTREGTE